jgi:hypothetical protein
MLRPTRTLTIIAAGTAILTVTGLAVANAAASSTIGCRTNADRFADNVDGFRGTVLVTPKNTIRLTTEGVGCKSYETKVSLASLRGPQGFTGARGATGARGPAGAPGTPGTPGTITRWALVNANGVIEDSSGGFTVKSAYENQDNNFNGLLSDGVTATPGGAVGNVYIDAGQDLTGKAIIVSLALNNQNDVNGDTIKNGRAVGPDLNPEFSGEVVASSCGLMGVVSCAPPGTNNTNHFVVSPRLSDGQVTSRDPNGDGAFTDNNHKRFYVTIVD